MEAGLTAAAVLLAGVALAATTIGYRNTKAALAEAEENLSLARSAVDELHTDVSEIDLQDQPGLQPLKQKLLRRALSYYQKFLERNRGDRTLTVELADSFARVGAITEEVESTKSALPHFQEAAKIQRALLQKTPGDLKLKEGLSDSLNAIGRVEQKLQDFADAKTAYEESRKLRGELVKSEPANRDFQRKLANVVMNNGLLKVKFQDLAGAEQDYQAAQALRQGCWMLRLMKRSPGTLRVGRITWGRWNWVGSDWRRRPRRSIRPSRGLGGCRRNTPPASVIDSIWRWPPC